MTKQLLIAILVFFSGLEALGQETLVDDLPPAFEGTISYRVRYEGPNSRKWEAFLPDSVEIMAQGGNLHVRAYGGVSDSLLHEYVWLAEADECYAIDRRSEIVWSSPETFKAEQRTATHVPAGKDSLLGRAVKTYNLDGGKESYKVAEGIHFPIPDWDSSTVSRPPFLAGGLKTLPLWIRQEGHITSISEAVSISPHSTPITLPEDFEVKAFFSREIRHPYIGKED